jgi:nucleotide sugar dehydrogenase
MPPILHIKPEEIDSIEKRGKYTVCVIGCGRKGITYAISFAQAGFKVRCFDADQIVVKRLAKGKTLFSKHEVEDRVKGLVSSGQIVPTTDLKTAVSTSDIIVMAITPKIDERKNPDYSEVERNSKQVGVALHPGTLFIYSGLSGLGFTESIIKEILENTSGLKTGDGFGLVYIPLQASNGQDIHLIADQDLSIAGMDKISLSAASAIFETITGKRAKTTMDIRAAELAVLFAAARRDSGIALANELAVLCESAGSDYFKVLWILDSEKPAVPPIISEEENQNETYTLLENAESLNAKLRLSKLSRQINEEAFLHGIGLTQETLRSCGKTFRRARVAVLGSARAGTPADVFARMLEARGAKVSLYDPLLAKSEPSEPISGLKRSLNEAAEGADCLVLFAGQDQIKRLNLKKLRAVMKTPAAIVDLVGLDEPKQIEKEGFIYRGFGRGTEKR